MKGVLRDGGTAIVTGGASGIGRSIVRALAQRGMRVVVADIDAAAAASEAAILGAQGCAAVAATVDVADAAAVELLVSKTEARWGGLDLLVNNAGFAHVGDLLDMDEAAWRRSFAVNLWGVVSGVRAAYPRMAKRGAGCIVNTASVAGLTASPGFAIYSSAKHAVVGLSRSLRAEAKRYGVQVNVLCPGLVSTRFAQNAKFVAMDGGAASARLEAFASFADPERVAADLIRGIEKDRPMIITPTLSRLFMAVLRHLPSVEELIAAKLMDRIREYRSEGPPAPRERG